MLSTEGKPELAKNVCEVYFMTVEHLFSIIFKTPQHCCCQYSINTDAVSSGFPDRTKIHFTTERKCPVCILDFFSFLPGWVNNYV